MIAAVRTNEAETEDLGSAPMVREIARLRGEMAESRRQCDEFRSQVKQLQNDQQSRAGRSEIEKIDRTYADIGRRVMSLADQDTDVVRQAIEAGEDVSLSPHVIAGKSVRIIAIHNSLVIGEGKFCLSLRDCDVEVSRENAG